MISHDRPTHKFVRLGSVILCLVLPLLMVVGCGGESDSQSRNTSQHPADAPDCAVVVDISGWEAFENLGERCLAGEDIPESEFLAFGEHPVISLWRQSMTERVPSASKVGHWAEGAFWDEIGKGRPLKRNADRNSFGKSMRFSFDHRDEINPMLQRFIDEGHQCRVETLVRKWFDPENIPEPLAIRFVAAKPELRSHHGKLVADTGLLLAGGPEQLSRQLVSILYRDRQAMQGPNPLELEGQAAVAQVFRIMMNEGVAAWIDDMPNTHFSAVHPRLGKVAFVPESVYTIGIRAMDIFNSNLPRMLNSSEAMDSSGQDLARAITGAGAFTQGGYCMSETIVHHLGEDRLLQVKSSPLAFVQAYQEAALRNTLPLPIPGEQGRELPESMPALSNEVYEGIVQILGEEF